MKDFCLGHVLSKFIWCQNWSRPVPLAPKIDKNFVFVQHLTFKCPHDFRLMRSLTIIKSKLKIKGISSSGVIFLLFSICLFGSKIKEGSSLNCRLDMRSLSKENALQMDGWLIKCVSVSPLILCSVWECSRSWSKERNLNKKKQRVSHRYIEKRNKRERERENL